MFLLLVGITLIIGAVGIANTTLTESTAAGRPSTYPALRAARIEPVEVPR